jgi:hypothetical protein
MIRISPMTMIVSSRRRKSQKMWPDLRNTRANLLLPRSAGNASKRDTRVRASPRSKRRRLVRAASLRRKLNRPVRLMKVTTKRGRSVAVMKVNTMIPHNFTGVMIRELPLLRLSKKPWKVSLLMKVRMMEGKNLTKRWRKKVKMLCNLEKMILVSGRSA